MEIIFFDTEVDPNTNKMLDVGAVTGKSSINSNQEFHSKSISDFYSILSDKKYICGHNILNHDLTYLDKNKIGTNKQYIDTLFWSPLLFPKKPYHRLVKDDKLFSEELSNPLTDAKKARDLFYDEEAAFNKLDEPLKKIYFYLLNFHTEFKGFFHYLGYKNNDYNTAELIRKYFTNKICDKSNIQKVIEKYPVELAYALCQINVIKYDSITPPWVLKTYPKVENILNLLRSKNCRSCSYCIESLDETKALKRFFGYDEFRSYESVPLQQNAVHAAVEGKSILAIFPTGGGKSITFQLPALIAGESEKGLTVVISPLKSLMKDQTDNLENKHSITRAVTINSSLDPLERAKAFERVEDGSANILYISPESLRSKSIESLLLNRNVVRFVIDEAHCFSSWGQDFRVDYLYIGDFIRNLQEKKLKPQNIPISCFTATAKQKVITDIKEYFKEKLSIELELFKTSAERENLHYHFFSEEDNNAKYTKLRELIEANDCPAIIYVSRTSLTERLASKLDEDGYPAKPYHGKMDNQTRIMNQNAFMQGEIKIIVATTAFGMGVDKEDIGMVIHFDISDSIENYVQEAGRAGRDKNINANCYVLFNDEDLNKHFTMLNQTKMSQKEIQQVWRALKRLTRTRAVISQSALEIARESGWDDSVQDIETRVKTAINALEQAGFVKRGQNMPRIFADSILVKNMEEARTKIDNSPRFDDTSREQAIRIINNLISAKYKSRGKNEEGESRIDYISDRLGIVKENVIKAIRLLREEKILADAKDLTAFIKNGKNSKQSEKILLSYRNIENFLFNYLDERETTYNIKEMNEKLQENNPDTSINHLNTILNYFEIKHYIKKYKENKNYFVIKPNFYIKEIKFKSEKRQRIARDIIEYLYTKSSSNADDINTEHISIYFSVLELKTEIENRILIIDNEEKINSEDIEDALYYLLKIGAMEIEGGFLVIYNAMQIERLENDFKLQYTKDKYAKLDEYYQNKKQQIHIVGEYANQMINNPDNAKSYVSDYFEMDYKDFLQKYFKDKLKDISRNITPKKFRQLFGELSAVQRSIIDDKDSNYIVVAAGPGSGKTKLLIHKLASLSIMEDVKHEQMLMLTFSRAAATEFKKRLLTLIGNAANFIQIMTFHSYCFDLLGKVGNKDKADKIIIQTIEKIKADEVDLSRITKTVLVIDEAQDMSEAEYSLIETMIEKNDNLRIIAVGDDDQNIYQFRGSDSKYFASLLNKPAAKKYEMVENYRSNSNIVEFANNFAMGITNRFKTASLIPIKKENGAINICTMGSNNIAISVVNMAVNTKFLGSICIITRTNEEALNIVGLLLKNGIKARQIQTNEEFNLYNLVELREFIINIDKNAGYAIDEDVWNEARNNLLKKYKDSSDLPNVIKLIEDFEKINYKTKYKSDFKQYVYESKLEDFTANSGNPSSGEIILVSTIHQTKGREFDNVILGFSRFYKLNDENKREIYVAVTRAKKNLHILYNGNYFEKINAAHVTRKQDIENYPEPDRIYLQLSHKDVKLGFFAYRQKEIDSLISGKKLMINEKSCLLGNTEVLKFSEKFCNRITELKSKGYSPVKAVIRHIVYYLPDDIEKEIKIILPDIEFVKE